MIVSMHRCFAAGGSDDAEAAAAVASKVYNTLWTAICDAKVRRRRGDGTIITEEQAAAAIAAEAKRLKEKAELWESRKEQLESEREY